MAAFTGESSALQEAFASPAMARLLAFLAVHPDQPLHIRELYRRTGLGMASLQKELGRFQQLGLLRRRPEGRRVLYDLDPSTEQWRAMRTLLRTLARPWEVLREAFTGVEGVDAAFVFGSHARGDARTDSDVDLFVVGSEHAVRAVQDALAEAESLMGRDVDLVTYSVTGIRARLHTGNDFLARVRREPKRWVAGDPTEWTELEERS